MPSSQVARSQVAQVAASERPSYVTNMTYRQVVCRNAYHLGHVEPILANKLMIVGQNVVMILVLYLPSATKALLEYKTSRLKGRQMLLK